MPERDADRSKKPTKSSGSWDDFSATRRGTVTRGHLAAVNEIRRKMSRQTSQGGPMTRQKLAEIQRLRRLRNRSV